MIPVTVIALVDAAITLLARLAPIVGALKRSNTMTPAEEALLDERIAKLRSLPNWQF
jgi:hypothetical protein